MAANTPCGAPVLPEHHFEIHYPDFGLLKEGESIYLPDPAVVPFLANKKKWASIVPLSKTVRAARSVAVQLADIEPSAIKAMDLSKMSKRGSTAFVTNLAHAMDFVGRTYLNMAMVKKAGSDTPVIRIASQTTVRVVKDNPIAYGIVDKDPTPLEITLNPVYHDFSEERWQALADRSYRMSKVAEQLWWQPLDDQLNRANIDAYNSVAAAILVQGEQFEAEGKADKAADCKAFIDKMLWDMANSSIEPLPADFDLLGHAKCPGCNCHYGRGCDTPVRLLCPGRHVFGHTCAKLMLALLDGEGCLICNGDIPEPLVAYQC